MSSTIMKKVYLAFILIQFFFDVLEVVLGIIKWVDSR
jgi:hypothetical protein